MSLIDIFKKKTASSNIYDTLTQKQKLAAMNLMVVFGGSCSGTEYELDKINHIMASEGQLMGISGNEMRAGASLFNGMEGMVNMSAYTFLKVEQVENCLIYKLLLLCG